MADEDQTQPGAQTAETTFTGTSDDDTFVGTNADETFVIGAGNDSVTGGLGNDRIIGGTGEDSLVGDTQTGQDFNPGVLAITEDYELSVDFASGGNTGNDVIGMYKINPTTAQIESITIVDQDVSNGGGTFSSALVTGEQIGFFVVRGGFAKNDFDVLGAGNFQIVTEEGGQDSISHTGASLQHVSHTGLTTPIYGYLLFSSAVKRRNSDFDHQLTTGQTRDHAGRLKIEFDDAMSLLIEVDRFNSQGRNDPTSHNKWKGATTSDILVYAKGGSQNTIRDFKVNLDQIDLSAYSLNYEYLKSRMINHGWATEINLERNGLTLTGDKIVLSAIEPDDLDETNFIF